MRGRYWIGGFTGWLACMGGFAVYSAFADKSLPAKVEQPADPWRAPLQQVVGPKFFVDPDTGCHYLFYDGAYKAALTPRLTADGRILCIK